MYIHLSVNHYEIFSVVHWEMRQKVNCFGLILNMKCDSYLSLTQMQQLWVCLPFGLEWAQSEGHMESQ